VLQASFQCIYVNRMSILPVAETLKRGHGDPEADHRDVSIAQERQEPSRVARAEVHFAVVGTRMVRQRRNIGGTDPIIVPALGVPFVVVPIIIACMASAFPRS
jgi:hypothetical protein